jgi:hypothetical protein
VSIFRQSRGILREINAVPGEWLIVYGTEEAQTWTRMHLPGRGPKLPGGRA